MREDLRSKKGSNFNKDMSETPGSIKGRQIIRTTEKQKHTKHRRGLSWAAGNVCGGMEAEGRLPTTCQRGCGGDGGFG